jgi:ribose transport system substrate-binding protein
MTDGTKRPGRDREHRFALFLALLIACVVVVIGLSACGGSTSSSSSTANAESSEAGSGAENASSNEAESSGEGMTLPEAEKITAELYKGRFTPPPRNAAKGVPGKQVWVISCGQQYATCATVTKGVEEAGKVLEWNVTTYNGNAGNPSQTNTGVKQAVAAGADAIVTVAADCPTIKSGLLAAKSASIPVVNYAGVDCDDPSFGGGEPLFTASTFNVVEYSVERMQANAQFMVARLTEEGIADPKIMAFETLEQAFHKAGWEAWNTEVEAICPNCEVVNEPFAVSQVPNPAAADWKTEVLANPDANAAAIDTNSWIIAGLGAAIKASPNKEMFTCCGDNTDVESIGLVEEGQISALQMWSNEYYAWATANVVNELFAGVKPSELPNEGGGFIFIDEEHNLPPEGQAAPYPTDFKAEFSKSWTGA